MSDSGSRRSGELSGRLGLRVADHDDVEWIRNLNEAAVPAVNSVPAEFFDAWIAAQQREATSPFFVVAQQIPHEAEAASSTRLGFVLALPPACSYESLNYRWFSDHYSRFLYVDRIVVDGAQRGLGVGQLLYDGAVAETERRRLERVCCEVNVKPRNEGSLRFHSRYGFREVGQQATEECKKIVSLQVLELASR